MEDATNSGPKATDRRKRKGWATDEQDKWLRDHVPMYLAAQAGGFRRLSEFWPLLWEGWFSLWPESLDEGAAAARLNDAETSLGARSVDAERPVNASQERHPQAALPVAVQAKRIRLKQWFNNHARGVQTTEMQTKLLDLQGKKTKKLQPTQAYSRLYYEEKLKAAIAERWEAHVLTNPEDVKRLGPSLKFRNKTIKSLYDEEPPEVKAEVERHREEGFPDEELELEEDEDEDIGPEEQKRCARASAYQKAQNCLALSMTHMLEQVEAEAGLVGTVILGGPKPKRGGKVVVMSFHSRKLAAGNNFSQAYSRWYDHVERPFVAYLDKIFNAAVCDSRALPGTADMQIEDDLSNTRLGTPNSNLPRATPDPPSKENETAPAKGNGRTTEEKGKQPRTRGKAVIQKSEYELERERNIARNKALLGKLNEEWRVRSEDMEGKSRGKRDKAASVAKDNHAEPTDSTANCNNTNQTAGSEPDAPMSPNTLTILANQTSAFPKPGVLADCDGAHQTDELECDVPVTPNTQTISANQTSTALPKLGANIIVSPVGPATKDSDLMEHYSDRGAWPSWLQTAYVFLEEVSVSSKWVELISKLVVFEGLLGFSTMGRLECIKQPTVVHTWLKNGRKYAVPPKITDISEYMHSWWAWWSALQPGWWHSADGLLSHQLPDGGEKWPKTLIGGANGFFMIVLTIAWGIMAVNGDLEDKELSQGFNDILWVLDNMILTIQLSEPSLSLKRTHDVADTDGATKKRRKN